MMGKSLYISDNILPCNRQQQQAGHEYRMFWKKIEIKKKKVRKGTLSLHKPYLDTTTSKQVENTKAFEITIIKELGKLTP